MRATTPGVRHGGRREGDGPAVDTRPRLPGRLAALHGLVAREAGANPARSRHCHPGAGAARTRVGHWGDLGRLRGPRRSPGSQETCLRPAPDNALRETRSLSAHFTFRVSLAAACAAGLAAAPAAPPSTPPSGSRAASANLIPESAIPIEGAGTATVFDANFAPVDVSRASAFWQLYRATSSTGLGLGFSSSRPSPPSSCSRSAPTPTRASSAGSTASTTSRPPSAPTQRALDQGDSVLWYYGAVRRGARARRRPPPRTGCAAGDAFTVAVTSYGADGAGGAGRRRDGDATAPPAATADASGRGDVRRPGAPAPAPVGATRAGDIRSAARPVCSFGDDPAVCNLPAAPAPARDGRDGRRHGRPGQPHPFPRIGWRPRVVRAIQGRRRARPVGRRHGRGGAGATGRDAVPLPRALGRPHDAPALLAPALRAGPLGGRQLGARAGQGPGARRCGASGAARSTAPATARASACARVNTGQFRVER